MTFAGSVGLNVLTLSCVAAVSMIDLARAEPSDRDGPAPGSTVEGPAAPAEPATKVKRVRLDNGEWITVDETEVINVFAERTSKPIERDTELRLTGDELLARGSTTLADALDQIPQLQVRTGGRGGVQVNIRGGRKGAIKVLIDGVPVDEVFSGNFDISQIPVTDIAQIRVSMAPSSPLDGVGGPSGVIEVHTLDAVGASLVRLRAYGSSLPAGDLSATGRTEVAPGIAIRGSLTAALGMRGFDVLLDPESNDGVMLNVDEDRRALTGAVRLEYRRGRERFALDASTNDRQFVVPPGEDGVEDIIMIESDASTRVGISGDIERGRKDRLWRFQGRSYVQTLDRTSVRYSDPTLRDGRPERVRGTRVGGALVANHTLSSELEALATATIDAETGELNSVNGTVVTGSATISEIATGAQWKQGRLSADGALGVAIPIGVGERAWPEAKLSGTYSPDRALGFRVTLGRKGRLPTLRERFRPDVGNPTLNPEKSSFIEVETTLRPVSSVRLKSAVYIRDSDGQIRFDLSRGQLTNVNNLIVRGLDSDADIELNRLLSLGASYGLVDSYSPTFGVDSLDFLPRHRIEARISATWGRGSARARVRYQSSQVDQTTKIPPRTTLDISGSMRVTENLRASLRLDNLLGDRYILRRGGLLSPGRVMTLALQTSWR